jgi:gliding motility-associated transport system permease protein
MNKIVAIAKKELLYFLNNPLGYIYLLLLTVITNWLYFSDFFIKNTSSMDSLFSNLFFILIFFIPVVTMSSISEEKKQSTWEVILSLPVTDLEVILGKFVGIFVYSLFSLILFLPVVFTLFFIGQPDLGVITGQFIGAIFLMSAYISTGIFFSSLSSQPLTSFVSTFSFLLLSNLMSTGLIFSKLPLFLQKFVQYINLNTRASGLMTGLVDFKDIIFFLSWNIIFIISSTLLLKKRNQ